MKRFILLVASIAFAALLNGCGNSASSADAPPDFNAVAGDSSVTITWTAAADTEYWLFYAVGSNVTTENWLSIGGNAVQRATSPYTITGLANGTTYSFTINARKNGGPGGPGAPTKVVSPRMAGAAWTVGTPLGTGRLNGASSVATANIIVGSGGSIYAGLNGVAPAAQTNPSAPADLNAAIFTGLGFLAVGNAGTAVFSTDATTWTSKTTGTVADLYGLASTAVGSNVAVGAGGTIVTSTDATTWVTQTSGTTRHLYGAVYGTGRYVAVGAGGTIVTSIDGTTWLPAVSNTTNDLRGVAFGVQITTTGTGTAATTVTTNTFVAVGASGTVLTSNDGLTWTVRTALSPNTLNSVIYGGQYVAVGNGGVIFTSADGITWVARTSGTTNDLLAVSRSSGGYIAVGAAGTYLTAF